jgi:hypothetical protein
MKNAVCIFTWWWFPISLDDCLGMKLVITKLFIVTIIGNIPEIPKQEYLKGFIVTNSRLREFRQYPANYHYRLATQSTYAITISGNYILKILDENREVLFSRKIHSLRKKVVTIPISSSKYGKPNYLDFKHNIEFSIKSC